MLDVVMCEGLNAYCITEPAGAEAFATLYGLDSTGLPIPTPSTAGAGAALAPASAEKTPGDAVAGAGAALPTAALASTDPNQEQMDEGGQPAACTATALPLDASQPAAQGGKKQMDEAAYGGATGRLAFAEEVRRG